QLGLFVRKGEFAGVDTSESDIDIEMLEFKIGKYQFVFALYYPILQIGLGLSESFQVCIGLSFKVSSDFLIALFLRFLFDPLIRNILQIGGAQRNTPQHQQPGSVLASCWS